MAVNRRWNDLRTWSTVVLVTVAAGFGGPKASAEVPVDVLSTSPGEGSKVASGTLSAVERSATELGAEEGNDAEPSRPSPRTTTPSEPGLRRVKVWDFTKPKLSSERWHFPGGNPVRTPKGMLYFPANASGGGPRLKELTLRAIDVSHVRVHITLEMHRGGTTRPAQFESLRLYWARLADVQEGGNWPFSNPRSVGFEVLDDSQPSVWTADVSTHGHWIGTIKQFFIALKMPEGLPEGSGKWAVCLNRFEFLTDY